MLNQLDFLTSKIVATRTEKSAEQAVLVGISGIDAGGKGFITEKIAQRLQESGWRVATINADDWLNLPEVTGASTATNSAGSTLSCWREFSF